MSPLPSVMGQFKKLDALFCLSLSDVLQHVEGSVQNRSGRFNALARVSPLKTGSVPVALWSPRRKRRGYAKPFESGGRR